MYRLIQLLIFSTSLLIAKPKSIAVLDFEGKDISDSEASILTDRLRSELFNLGNYKVLERALMEDILKSKDSNKQAFVTHQNVRLRLEIY